VNYKQEINTSSLTQVSFKLGKLQFNYCLKMLNGFWVNKLHNEPFVNEIYFLKQLLTHTKWLWAMIRQDSIENSDILYMRQYKIYIHKWCLNRKLFLKWNIMTCTSWRAVNGKMTLNFFVVCSVACIINLLRS
jgi:hypothetical protein